MKTIVKTKHSTYIWAFLFLWMLIPGVTNLYANPIKNNATAPTIGFTENKGQIGPDSDVHYYLRSQGVACYLQSDGISYFWKRKVENEGEGEMKLETVLLKLSFDGANPKVNVSASDPSTYLQHFYTADHPEGIRDVQTYEQVIYEEIYPSIDLIFYFEETQLKYDFIVKPGGKVSDIQLRYAGYENLNQEVDGSISISHALGTLQEGTPYSYQMQGEERIPVSSQYQVNEDVIQFQVVDYDTTSTLIIDPTLLWATYYGGEESEWGNATYTDQLANVYMVGRTDGPSDHIWMAPGFQEVFGGEDIYGGDAFLVKFAPNGVRLWATYYGGHSIDYGTAVCTDPDRNVYMAGTTASNTGIAHNGHDNELARGADAFLVKFDENGVRLWATYYGGIDNIAFEGSEESAGYEWSADRGNAVATDAAGNVFLAGTTNSKDAIPQNGHDNTFNGATDAFLVKFSPLGNRIWATYYGGSGLESGNAVVTDVAGEVYLAGKTSSSSGIAHNGHDLTYSEDGDGFLVKFNAAGTRLWGTYYGDTGIDEVTSLAMEGGFLYMAGTTSSSNFIAHLGHDMVYNGGVDAFLVKFNMFGTRIWGTYYGGKFDEKDPQTTTSVNGEVYLAGSTKSPSHIATSDGYDPTYNGNQDGYLVQFLPNGTRQWGTFYGGSEFDDVKGVTTDFLGSVYICGYTQSDSKIAYHGHDNSFSDKSDAFLAKFYPYLSDRSEGEVPLNPTDNTNKGWPHEGEEEKLLLILSPNPTRGQLRITYAGSLEDGPYQLRIMDTQGGVIYKSKPLDGPIDKTLDFGQLKRGIYHVSLLSPSQVLTENLQVE